MPLRFVHVLRFPSGHGSSCTHKTGLLVGRSRLSALGEPFFDEVEPVFDSRHVGVGDVGRKRKHVLFDA